MLSTQLETMDSALEEMKALFVLHYKELAEYQDKKPLDPDYDMYRRIEKSGNLFLLTVRDSGKLIAYYVAFVKKGLHYNSTSISTQDIFYVDKSCRLKGIGHLLFSSVKLELKKRGIQVWKASCKVGEISAQEFLEKEGFKADEIHSSQWIGD